MRLISFFLYFLCLNAHAFDLSHLSREERNRLYNGEFVLKTQKVKDAPWPRLTILRIIDSEPVLFAAFFANFEEQINYVPKLIKAKELVGSNPLDVAVDYEMNLPWPLSNARYTHAHRLSWEEEKNYIKVEWYLVQSSVADHVEGFAEFFPYNQKTLWHYQAFVRPKSALAGFFSSNMQKDTLASLRATLEAFKRSDKNLIDASTKLWRTRFKRSTK